jgi:hypothetical protein
MNAYLRMLCFALALGIAPTAGNSHPLNAQIPVAASSQFEKVCWGDDCWRDRWRSRHQWESHESWTYHRWVTHDAWRSGWRRYHDWDDGGYDHSRYYSHYRWGSYHRLCCGGGWPY